MLTGRRLDFELFGPQTIITILISFTRHMLLFVTVDTNIVNIVFLSLSDCLPPLPSVISVVTLRQVFFQAQFVSGCKSFPLELLMIGEACRQMGEGTLHFKHA